MKTDIRAFSLPELLVVLVIIGILVLAALPNLSKRLRGYVLTGLLFVKTILKSRDCGQRKSRAIRPAFSLPTYLEGDFCRLRPGSR